MSSWHVSQINYRKRRYYNYNNKRNYNKRYSDYQSRKEIKELVSHVRSVKEVKKEELLNFIKNIKEKKIKELLSSVSFIKTYTSNNLLNNLLNYIEEDIIYIFNLFADSVLSECDFERYYHDNLFDQKEKSINDLFNILNKFIKDLKEKIFINSPEEIYEYILNFSKNNNLKFVNSLDYLQNEIYHIYNKIKENIKLQKENKREELLGYINSIESYVSKDLLNCIKEDMSYILDSFIEQVLSEYNIEMVKSGYHNTWFSQKQKSINDLFDILNIFIKNLKEIVSVNSLEKIYEYILEFYKSNNLKFVNSLNYLKDEIYHSQLDSYYNKIKNEIETNIGYKGKSENEKLKIDSKDSKDTKISKNLEKLLSKIINLVKKIDILNDSFNNLGFVNNSLKENIKNELQKLNKNKEEIIKYIQANDEINKNIKNFDHLELFYRNMEFNYLNVSKLIKTNIFHLELNDKLNKLRNILQTHKNLEKTIIDEINKFINEINSLIRSNFINENVMENFNSRYNCLIDDVEDFIYKEKEKQEIMANLIESLNDLGYSALITTSDGIIFFDSPLGIEYKIMLKMFKDKVAVKFVKIIEDNYVLSDTEKERDIELVKDWCKDYQKVLDYLKENNIYLETERIINPEDDPNLIYTNFSRLPIEVKELYSKQVENKKRFINKDKKQKQDYHQI